MIVRLPERALPREYGAAPAFPATCVLIRAVCRCIIYRLICYMLQYAVAVAVPAPRCRGQHARLTLWGIAGTERVWHPRGRGTPASQPAGLFSPLVKAQLVGARATPCQSSGEGLGPRGRCAPAAIQRRSSDQSTQTRHAARLGSNWWQTARQLPAAPAGAPALLLPCHALR